MRSHPARTALALAASLLGVGLLTAQPASAVNDFVAAESRWLSLVDAGRYRESWTEAGAWLKSSIPEEQWVTALTEVRKRAGRNLSREIATKDYVTGIEDGPKGHVFVLKHRSAFEQMPDAVETVTTIYEEESASWRVIGYALQKRPGAP